MMNPDEVQISPHDMRGYRARILRLGFACAMVVIITVLSLVPAYLFRTVESSLPLFPGFDKCVHGLMYFMLTLSVLSAVSPSARRPIRCLVCMAIATSLYGVLMEFCQGVLTSTRSMDRFDMLANSVGAFCGAGSVWLLIRGRNRYFRNRGRKG